MEDNIQLKEEEVVGDEVVLTDIYPKTNTNSIVDESSGRQLNETLDFIWQKINNKLSRVVNSVNNKTGVVVLTGEDVGLGNVDNVSFDDIKQWVVNLLIQEFGNKRIMLVDHLDEIDDAIKEPYDLRHRDQPFFSKYGYSGDNDKKSYIGYIYYDAATKSLKCAYKAIRVVGSTDQSLLYNDDNGNVKLHIWNGQDIIKVRDTGITEDSGVYLDENALHKGIRYFDGVYNGTWLYDGTNHVINGFATLNASESVQKVVIGMYIHEGTTTDGEDINYEIITTVDSRTKFSVGEIVYCGFKPLFVDMTNTPVSGAEVSLMNREPCMGVVQRVSATVDPDSRVMIIFFPNQPNLGWSMKSTMTNRDKAGSPKSMHPKTSGQAIDVSLASVRSPHVRQRNGERLTSNVSGLQVIAGYDSQNPKTNSGANLDGFAYYVNFPSGPVPVFDSTTRQSGLYINPDASLCIIPMDRFPNIDDQTDARDIDNWKPSVAGKEDNDTGWFTSVPDDELELYGIMSRPSLLGVNLTKAIFKNSSDQYVNLSAQNISGLRVFSKSDPAVRPTYDRLGFNYGEYEERYPVDRRLDTTTLFSNSGGLSVNVGKFLEIDPGAFPITYADMYNCGKVNVRIGKGLEEEPITYNEDGKQITGNKIQLKLSSGLQFTDDGALKVPGAISSVVEIDMVDNYDTHFIYNPIPQSADEDSSILKSTLTLTLGKGLKIVTDDMSIEEYTTLANALTGKQLEYYIDDASTMSVSLLKSKLAGLVNTAESNVSILQSEIDKIKMLQQKYPSSASTLPHYTKTLEEMITIAKNKGSTDFDIANMTLIHLENICILDSGVTLTDYIMETYNKIYPYHISNNVTVARILSVCGRTHTSRLVSDIISYLKNTIWSGSYDGCDPSLEKYYNNPDAENSFEKVRAISNAITNRIDNAQRTSSGNAAIDDYLWNYTFDELLSKFYIKKGIGGSNGVPVDADHARMVALITGDDAVVTQSQVVSVLDRIKSDVADAESIITKINDTGVSSLTVYQLNIALKWALPETMALNTYVGMMI